MVRAQRPRNGFSAACERSRAEPISLLDPALFIPRRRNFNCLCRESGIRAALIEEIDGLAANQAAFIGSGIDQSQPRRCVREFLQRKVWYPFCRFQLRAQSCTVRREVSDVSFRRLVGAGRLRWQKRKAEDGFAGALQYPREFFVHCRRFFLFAGERRVEHNRGWLALADVAHNFGPHLARPRPAPELILQFVKARVVYINDDDARIRFLRPRRPARARIESPIFQPFARSRELQRQPKNRRQRNGKVHTLAESLLRLGIRVHVQKMLVATGRDE